ncbi:MAG: ribonuclease HII [Pyramidobacter sp.]|uniref:ribonuclease HII n=1 Tax=Pyramidobacter sp. TaxID=1943581 RepID=UPI002A7F9DEB|nr:ribonuclease HII [Pyramidobacter sp.]MDY4033545.1 ribonuclease HII [Pyramidobacter sp.]
MILAGVDEAGRGPLAGPVVAAAVVLTEAQREDLVGLGLRDSKKMTPRRREKVLARILELNVVWRAAAAPAERIDRLNILRATLWAMRRAVEKLPLDVDGVIVDGNQEIPGLNVYQQAVVGGDDIYPQISAASVVAKVLRDRVMTVYDGIYPGYGFARHKGYGTEAHRRAIAELGPTPIHRRSFSWR